MDKPREFEVFDEITSPNALKRGEWSDWDAVESSLKRRLTLRKLSSNVMQTVERRNELIRQYQTLARHNHGNIVRVFSIDLDQGWIALERLTSLAKRVESNTEKATAENVLHYLKQAAAGLQYLHRQSLVHGRISLNTIGIDSDGQVKLMESEGFGIRDEIPASVGTVRHHAPELFDSEVFGSFGPASDVYCLGMAILELAMGPSFEKLFRGIPKNRKEDLHAWTAWHASNESLQPIDKYLKGWPPALIAVLTRMTAKHVEDRFFDASAVLKALDGFPLNGNGVDASEMASVNADQPAAGDAMQVYLGVKIGARSQQDEIPVDLVTRVVQAIRANSSRRNKTIAAVVGSGLLTLTMLPDFSKEAEVRTAPAVKISNNSTNQSRSEEETTALPSTSTDTDLTESPIVESYKFEFDVSPSEATVFLDDCAKQTGCMVNRGKHTLRVECEGYVTQELEWDMTKNETCQFYLHSQSDGRTKGLEWILDPSEIVLPTLQLKSYGENNGKCVAILEVDGANYTLAKEFGSTKSAAEELELDFTETNRDRGVIRLERLDLQNRRAFVSLSKFGIHIPVRLSHGESAEGELIMSSALTRAGGFSKSREKVTKMQDLFD